MDTHDFEALKDYWDRQADLHPEDIDILSMRALVVAEYIVHLAQLEL